MDEVYKVDGQMDKFTSRVRDNNKKDVWSRDGGTITKVGMGAA